MQRSAHFTQVSENQIKSLNFVAVQIITFDRSATIIFDFSIVTMFPISGAIKFTLKNVGFIDLFLIFVCRVMEEGKRVEIVDLHSAVIQECGEPPYKTCSIMRRPRDVVRYSSFTFCLMEFFPA